MTDVKDLAANIKCERRREEDNYGWWVVFWLCCAVAGFGLPTAFAMWMGWLDPIMK